MRTWKLAVVIAAFVTASPIAFAQTAPAQGGGQRRGQGMRGAGLYNPATETTFTGTVEEANTIAGPRNGPGGLHLVVQSDAGAQDVRVGPAQYVESKKVTFAKGDSVTVTGSKATLNGQSVVIAREIKKGDQVLTLRNEQGVPMWSRRGGR